jgi:hypothetical protein
VAIYSGLYDYYSVSAKNLTTFLKQKINVCKTVPGEEARVI